MRDWLSKQDLEAVDCRSGVFVQLVPVLQEVSMGDLEVAENSKHQFEEVNGKRRWQLLVAIAIADQHLATKTTTSVPALFSSSSPNSNNNNNNNVV